MVWQWWIIGWYGIYPLVMTYKKLLKMTIEIVDFPMEKLVIFHSYVNVYHRVNTTEFWWEMGSSTWVTWRGVEIWMFDGCCLMSFVFVHCNNLPCKRFYGCLTGLTIWYPTIISTINMFYHWLNNPTINEFPLYSTRWCSPLWVGL